MKKRKAFYHYNKPKSQQLGRPIISLHYDDHCCFLTELRVEVPAWSKIRKRQPYFVMECLYNRITVKGQTATIE